MMNGQNPYGALGADYEFLTPEALKGIFELGNSPERLSDLDAQMQQAMALRNPSGVQHSTPIGAALGGASDIMNSIASRQQEQRIRGERNTELDKNDQRRAPYNQAVIAEIRRMAQEARAAKANQQNQQGTASLMGGQQLQFKPY